MPFSIPPPTVSELIQAFSDGIRGEGNKYADLRRGSNFESISGPAAIIWSRLAHHDTDLFDAIYLGSADGTDLTNMMTTRFGIDRILDTRGQGTGTFTRPSTSGGAGTIWQGTRVTVRTATTSSSYDTRVYLVAQDTPVPANTKLVTVPMESESFGTGVAIDTDASKSIFVLEDPLWDSSLTPVAIQCADGTNFEPAPQARARVKSTIRDQRVGYIKEMIDVCNAQGATNVVFLDSDIGGPLGDDYGLPFCYVAGTSFDYDINLVKRCTVALENSRIMGNHLQVSGMQRQNVTIAADVFLWDSPARFNLDQITALASNAIVQYFKGTSSGYTYTRDALTAAIQRTTKDVQTVSFTTPASDANILAGPLPFFQTILKRYFLDPSNIYFAFHPPQ